MPSIPAVKYVGPFFIHISGLPKRYTWQNLKDLIRRKATSGIWTEMEVSNGRSTGSGYARVKKQDEAMKLYYYLTSNDLENMELEVHIFDISSSPPTFIGCTCGTSNHRPSYAEARRVAEQTDSSAWQPIGTMPPVSNPVVPAHTTAPYAQYARTSAPPPPTPDPRQAILAQQMAAMQIRQQQDEQRRRMQHSLARQQLHQQQQQRPQSQTNPRSPVYGTSATGTPINISSGFARKESRGIFVQGITFKAHTKEVEEYFSHIGDIVHCRLHKDERGKSKGTAEILFASADDAQRAIAKFHGQVWQGRKMSVRADRESTTIATPAATQPSASGSRDPVIVNGSAGEGRNQVRHDSAYCLV